MKETKNVFMSELTEVFSKRQQQFVQFAYSYVRNREEAEDIVMGAFTNVWEHRNELQEDTNISALLLTAIKNRSLNHLQHLEVRMRAEQHIGVETVAGAAERLSVSLEFFIKQDHVSVIWTWSCSYFIYRNQKL